MILRHLLRLIGHQYWLRFGIRDRIVRTFHNPDTCASETFIVPFFGVIYPGNFSTFIDWNTYYFGAYCKEELTIMRDALKGTNNPIILDIGANIGHHSLFASTIADQVHSFEPYQSVACRITEKIKINSIQNIEIHPIGLGEKHEDLPYSPPMSSNTGTGSFINSTKKCSSTVSLPIRIGDGYLKSLSLPKIDFIKMDIEGYEPQALRGLCATLEAYRPVVFFEWTENKRNILYNPEDLFPLNYRILNFISDQPVWGVFCKHAYRLIDEDRHHADGNKLAVPVEKLFLFEKRIGDHQNKTVIINCGRN